MLKFFAYYLLSVFLFILLINFGFKEPEFRYKKATYNPAFEKKIDGKIIDTATFAGNVLLLSNHYKKPYFQESEGNLLFRNDEALEKFYQNYKYSTVDSIQDIGSLALMIANYRTKLFELAHKYESNIKNKNVPYVHYFTGDLLLKEGYLEEGVAELKKELPYKVYCDSTYKKLAYYYYYTNDYDNLFQLYNNPEAKKGFPEIAKAQMYFLSGDVFAYINARFFNFKIAWSSFLAGFFIMLVWFFYVYQLKTYLPKKTGIYILVVVLGYILSDLCFILYDFYDTVLGWQLSGNIFNDFLYCIIGIGAIEVFTKLIPVLIFLSFKKNLDEPIDYIMLCSFSAIGFAFSENFDYFRIYHDHLSIIHSRGMNGLHLFCSGIVAYGIIQVKYKKKGIKTFLQYFLAAIICHGLFDLFLLNESLSIFYLYSYVTAFFGLYFYRIYCNNALNISPYFSSEIKINADYLKKYLIISITSVLLLEYLLNAFNEGPLTANDLLIEALIGFTVIIVVQVTSMSNFDLIYDYTIKPFQKRNTLYDTIIGKGLVFELDNKYQRISILSKEVFNQVPDFFIAKTETPITINNITSDLFVLQIKSSVSVKNSTTQYKGVFFQFVPSLDLNETNKTIQTKSTLFSTTFVAEEKAEIKPPASKLKKRLYIALILLSLFIGLIFFFVYMQYKTATQSYYWAEQFMETKDLYKASENLEYTLNIRPSYDRAHILLTKINLYLGEFESALESIEKGLKYSPNHMNELYLHGFINIKMKNYIPAIEDFSKVRSNENAPDSTYYFEAVARMSLQEFTLANALLDTFALKTNSKSFEVIFKKAVCKYNLNSYSDALTLFKTSLKINPKAYLAYHYIGLCELKGNNNETACLNFSKAYLHNITESEHYIQSVCNYIIYPEVDTVSTK